MEDELCEAIEERDIAELTHLLRLPGVDADAECSSHLTTPLQHAIDTPSPEMVEILLNHGVAVDGGDSVSLPSMQHACTEDHIDEDIVKLLILHGANVDLIMEEYHEYQVYCDEQRMTALTLASRYSSHLSVAELLLNAGADVNGGGGSFAPLHVAACYGNIEALELIISAGADVNILSSRTYEHEVPNGSTPLHFAIDQGKFSCFTKLLAAGADPNIGNVDGATPLHIAVYRSVDFVNALLAAGADPLHRNNGGRTAFQDFYDEIVCDEPFSSAQHFNNITALVAAGDRSWECVPTPCPGLEAAMVSVWQVAPDEMPELFKRLDDVMKKVVQEVLRVLHRHFAGFPQLKEHLLNCIFGFKFEEAAAAEEIGGDDDE